MNSPAMLIVEAPKDINAALLQSVPGVLTAAFAAIFGGFIVNQVAQRLQVSREKRDERRSIGLSMMRVAYGFHFPLMEATREFDNAEHARNADGQEVIDSIDRKYETFRIEARVIEEQLRVLFGRRSRWLWHGVVDMYSIRYYRFARPIERWQGMAKVHGSHPESKEIPPDIRRLFFTFDQYVDASADQAIVDRGGEMLNEVIPLVLGESRRSRKKNKAVAFGQEGSQIGHSGS